MYENMRVESDGLTLQEYAEAVSVFWTHRADGISLANVAARLGGFSADDVEAWSIETDSLLIEEV